MVDVRVPVLEDVLVEAVRRARRARPRLVGLELVLLHRGERRHRLPRRARWVDAARHAVDAGVVRFLRRLVVEERLELLPVDATDVDGRLVRRRGRHGEHRSVDRVERDEGAAVGVPRVVLPGGLDPVPQRALGGALEPDVDRQPHGAPRPRLTAGFERPLRASHRVDADLRLPRVSAEERVELRLDARLADLVAGLVEPRVAVEVLLRDLADVAEHLRRERLVGVVPQVRLLDLDARELGGVLVEVGDLVLADGGLDRDRVDRVGCALVDLLRERERRHAQDAGEPLDDGVAAVSGQVADPQLDGGASDVVDDDAAVPVEDRPARRLDPDRAELVPLRLRQVRVARQHLERPEPEEQHREDREGDDPEDPDPEREPRREPVRGLDPGVGRQEPRRRGARLAVRRVRAHTSSTCRAPSSVSGTARKARHTR